MKNNSEDRYLLGFDTFKNTSILGNTAAITSALTRILSFVAGKNSRASYRGPHARSSTAKMQANETVSPKRDKMIRNLSQAGGQHFFIVSSV